MAAEGGRLWQSLEIAIIVQKLINDYNIINNKGWVLDKLLFSLRFIQKLNLLRVWRPEHFKESTFLTDAVASRKQVIVAILLFTICPQRGSFCGFDEAFIFQISKLFPG